MNNNYYNAKIAEHEISYQPFLYDKRNSISQFAVGFIILIAGGVACELDLFDGGWVFGIIIGGFLMVKSCYQLLVKNKTTLAFNKQANALCQINAIGKKKLIELSNIYSISTEFESGSYAYIVTNNANPGAKSIAMSSFISKKRKLRAEVIYLEEKLLPAINMLLNDTKQ